MSSTLCLLVFESSYVLGLELQQLFVDDVDGAVSALPLHCSPASALSSPFKRELVKTSPCQQHHVLLEERRVSVACGGLCSSFLTTKETGRVNGSSHCTFYLYQ